ncbi:MAG: pilus (MSHA type) biogenesis protein MshL [Gammaproteobacteria bacterium]|nr:pilus (MSHA type) biogenesis protein MshL [Gammaproteobacteria bacterium]MCP5140673.1 pilus (MSHA type) biogenesis protein MshL [Chromatiales bacterium]
MTQNIWRRGAFLSIGVAALVAGCGTVQPFDPAPEHLKSVEGNRIIPAPVTRLPTPPAPVAQPVQETYTLVVTDVPVREVLFALARDAAINVDISGNIEGNVTLNAVNQTLPQILERISRQVSIRHNIENGTLVVMPDAPYWRNYRVDYVNLARGSEGEVTVATQVASTGGSVREDSQSSGGTNSDDQNISRTTVKSTSDNSYWQVLGNNLRQIVTGQATGSDAAAGPDPVAVNSIAGVISVHANSVQQQKVQAFIDQVTVSSKRQVLIEVTVVEVELNDSYQAGVDWSRVSANGGLGQDGISFINTLTGGNLSTAPVYTMKYANFDADGSGFSAAVKMLSQFGDTKVLSTPRIMALNNQTAMLKVVDERVYFSLSQDIVEASDNGPERSTITSEIKTVPVGFIMSVTPQISDNGNVSMNVRPTITRILGYVVDPAPRLSEFGQDFDNLVPEIHVSEIESLLEVADGQTVVIGGLMQDTSQKKRDGVPLLSRLPGVGDLFSYRDDAVKKSELVLFLRPTVIRGAGAGQPALASAAAPLSTTGKPGATP